MLGLVLEGYSLRTAVKESSTLKGESGWWHFIRHSRNPELPVVLLEDFGALIGLVLALIGIGLAAITGDARWDAYGTIAIGVLLVAVALVLVVEMKSLLIGESAREPMSRSIVDAIEGTDHVVRVLHMRTQHLGPEELLVAAKVEFDERLDSENLTEVIDRAEANVRAVVPIARMIYIEPDFHDPDHTDLDGEV
jgi:divalent metal cation (Fe/Co/Zn/Cd) transporter